MRPQDLAEALLQAVRRQRFDELPDHRHGGQPIAHFPSIDLAVIGIAPDAAPVFANVLFSREAPQGLIADIAPLAGPVTNIHYLKDQTDAAFESPAWFRAADWQAMSWQTLAGAGGQRFVEAYPASLVKLMVAVGIARQVDLGKLAWQQMHAWCGQCRSLSDWCEAMLTVSCNDATAALVLALHATGAIVRDNAGEVNQVEQLFAACGLATLRLADTQPDGGWRNADGAGVGHLCMTAWDTARLLWLLDADAPPAPWLAPQAVLLSPAARDRLLGLLARQGLHTVLSSTALAGQAGWVQGMPARLPAHWIRQDGSVQLTKELGFPADVRAANARAEVMFAHKTGGTDNYCSDAGIVTGIGEHRRHYIVALISNMGQRYAAPPDGVVNGKLAGLGRAIDQIMQDWLEAQ